MATQVLFNPLTYIDRLTRGGFSSEQARASAEALESAFAESVATRADIAELKHDIGDVESRLRSEITETEARLKLEIAGIKLEISQSKHETLRWVFAFNLGLIGAIFAIVKYVH